MNFFNRFFLTFFIIIIGAPFFVVSFYVSNEIANYFTGITQFFIYLIPFVFIIGVLYYIFNLGENEEEISQQPPQF